MYIRPRSPRRLRKLDAVHAVHGDIGNQQVHRVFAQVFQRRRAVGVAGADAEIRGVLAYNGLQKPQGGHFVVHEQYAIHGYSSPVSRGSVSSTTAPPSL